MRPEHITGKKVLYGCLDWGSGHVARSIPIIRQLQLQGNEVVFCGSPDQVAVLRQYGFDGTFLELPPTGFRFKGDGNFVREGLRNALVLRNAVQRERRQTAAFVKEHGIGIIVSDHRYGLHAEGVPTIFLTHQIQLPPGTSRLAQRIHRGWRMRFDTTWVLDDPEDSLAGALSVPDGESLYIGHRSRFSLSTGPVAEERSIVAIASGPEPYRSQLQAVFRELAASSSLSWTILCGADDWKRADDAIRSAGWIVSRNGYSTLMDLKILGKKAILLPTPGQTEQEYLARINENSDWNYVQSELDLAAAVQRLEREHE